MTVLRSIGLTLLLAPSVSLAHAQTTTKHVISLEAAKTIVEAAEAEASRRGTSVVIAVVDDGGYPILVERMDDTQPSSVETGIAKARTAAIFRRSTKALDDRIHEGRVALLALPGATPIQGGLPITFEDRVIGAIGVSGDTPQVDEEIATAGLAMAEEALRRPAAP